MAFRLIIDGYNLIRASATLAREEARGLEAGRKALLARLAAYKERKPRPMTVVFDAADEPSPAVRDKARGGIKVIFSAAGQTADEVIIALARRKGSQAVVVTSDRELARAVEEAGATAVSAPEFEARLERALGPDQGAAEEEEEVEPRQKTKKKGPARRAPKASRQRAQRLKKL